MQYVHFTFRNDLQRIDTAAFNYAEGKEGADATIGRFWFFNEVLVWHASGEEAAVFPVIGTVAPLVAESYEKDHRGLDRAFDELNISYSARDPLKTARATAAIRFHLNIHLDKEDTHLYRIFRERISLPDQGKVLSIMAGTIPRERFAEPVGGLYPLIGHDDRENMTRIWQAVMPAPVFAGVKELIQKAVGSDRAELIRRIPAL